MMASKFPFLLVGLQERIMKPPAAAAAIKTVCAYGGVVAAAARTKTTIAATAVHGLLLSPAGTSPYYDVNPRTRIGIRTIVGTSNNNRNNRNNSNEGEPQPSSSSSPQEPVFTKIACIGTGIICQALVEPMIRNGLQPAENFTMYDVNLTTLQSVQDRFPGIHTASSIANAVEGADLILLAVKPQNLTPSFFAQFSKERQQQPQWSCFNHSILLSVVAGKGMDVFLDAGFTKIVRSMPNTPATIGEGMTVWSATNNLDLTDRGKIDKMLSSCGATMYVDDESYIDMATSISGSGPAYIFLLMESMVDAGVHMGFPRDQATKLVYQTMLGSTLYAMHSQEHPAILRNRVTSPSGTTASALYELENGRFRTVIKDAMWACYRRSLEMGASQQQQQQQNHHHSLNDTATTTAAASSLNQFGPGRSSHHTPV